MNNLYYYYEQLGGKYVPPPKVDPPPYKGFMAYSQKTGAELNICKSPETFDYIKKVTNRISNQSVCRIVMDNGGKPQ